MARPWDFRRAALAVGPQTLGGGQLGSASSCGSASAPRTPAQVGTSAEPGRLGVWRGWVCASSQPPCPPASGGPAQGFPQGLQAHLVSVPGEAPAPPGLER